MSPDFHRIIEHVHATAAKAFRKELRELASRRSSKFYQELYEKVFYREVKASSVQADIRGLKQLWQHVKTPTAEGGSGGNWPPNSML